MFASCGKLFVDPAAGSSGALALQFNLTPGSASAFDSADAATIHLTTPDGGVLFDKSVTLSGSGATREASIDVDIRSEALMVNLQTELLAKSAPLFQGSSTFAIKRSQTTSVQVTLSPVVSAIPIPDSFPTITAIGDSSRLQCAALFATRDTIHGLSPSWSSLDPQVLRVSVSGVAVAITEGEAHVRAAVGNTSATLRVQYRPLSDPSPLIPAC